MVTAPPTHAETMKIQRHHQTGSSLIEVLVAILLLSFGMLALGAMLSFSVLAPKLSAYRATAANLAASHVERIRANPEGFSNDRYTAALNGSGWSFTEIALSDCAYPNCTEASLATMDEKATRRAVRRELPAGDMVMWCSTPAAPTSPVTCTKTTQGNLWIVWQEPNTNSLLSQSSDQCPSFPSDYLGALPARCLYVLFKIQ
jgi:type IV pilus assembly protein PilV